MRLPSALVAVLVVAFAGVVPARAAGAQQQITDSSAVILEPGTRIRLIVPTLGRDPIVGTVTLRTRDTIVVDTSDVWRQRRLFLPAPVIADEFRRVQLPIADVDSVEVSHGRSRSLGMLQGALRGGLLVGAYVGLSSLSRRSGDRLGNFATGFANGAVIGVALGVPLGYVFGSERWQPVAIAKPWRRPARGTIAEQRDAP